MFNDIYSTHPNLFLQLASLTLSPVRSHLCGTSSSITWNFPCLKYVVLAMPNLPGFCKPRSSWRTLLGNPTGKNQLNRAQNRSLLHYQMHLVQLQSSEKWKKYSREQSRRAGRQQQVRSPVSSQENAIIRSPSLVKEKTLNWTWFLSHN